MSSYVYRVQWNTYIYVLKLQLVLTKKSSYYFINMRAGDVKLLIRNWCFNSGLYVGLLIILLSSISNQAEGKKRMKSIGKVDVPQEAFMAVLKLEKEVIWLCLRVSCNTILNCKYIKKILESCSLFVWYNCSIVILWSLVALYKILDPW